MSYYFLHFSGKLFDHITCSLIRNCENDKKKYIYIKHLPRRILHRKFYHRHLDQRKLSSCLQFVEVAYLFVAFLLSFIAPQTATLDPKPQYRKFWTSKNLPFKLFPTIIFNTWNNSPLEINPSLSMS